MYAAIIIKSQQGSDRSPRAITAPMIWAFLLAMATLTNRAACALAGRALPCSQKLNSTSMP